MNNRNASEKLKKSISKEIQRNLTKAQPLSWVREQRQGYRASGLYQLSRHYGAEGFYTVGVGGPPIVGE